MSDVRRLALTAVRRVGYSPGWSSDQVEVAFGAAVEYLYGCREAPEASELLAASWRALSARWEKNRRFFGKDQRRPGERSRGFQRYWSSVAGGEGGFEDRVVEWRAVVQIWPLLAEGDRAVLVELARADGDAGAAARALGMERAVFMDRVRRARGRFLVLWHDGEVPSTVYGKGRRGGDARHSVTYFLRLRARRRALELAGQSASVPVPGQEEIRERYARGQSIATIAEAMGLKPMTVHKRMVQAGIPRRPRNSLIAARRIDVDTDDIARRYAQGESTYTIAQALGVSRSVITNRLKRVGIPRRAPGGTPPPASSNTPGPPPDTP
ncbi:helix-turn-helix domain-containing protein [Actinocorallia sp. API 0066]|uniref:helix-turn-helix domain-containing protein n=1 Tax=Actinocorallia sp. API 0066 TaxID=2896846 RepID=UPI001E4A7E6A|nr:helix-turn-helix domain-containing protein [Actinocorallia sp. API 0066]MCD0449655.1 helix-turn-helix domain-containing protein [Actinocorallia sp. API 0066]